MLIFYTPRSFNVAQRARSYWGCKWCFAGNVAQSTWNSWKLITVFTSINNNGQTTQVLNNTSHWIGQHLFQKNLKGILVNILLSTRITKIYCTKFNLTVFGTPSISHISFDTQYRILLSILPFWYRWPTRSSTNGQAYIEK